MYSFPILDQNCALIFFILSFVLHFSIIPTPSLSSHLTLNFLSQNRSGGQGAGGEGDVYREVVWYLLQDGVCGGGAAAEVEGCWLQ